MAIFSPSDEAMRLAGIFSWGKTLLCIEVASSAPLNFNNLQNCEGKRGRIGNFQFFALKWRQICAQQRAKLSKSKFRVVFISPLREEFEQRGQANRR
jgi:hypothetical protein